jgi:hypothetical protein
MLELLLLSLFSSLPLSCVCCFHSINVMLSKCMQPQVYRTIIDKVIHSIRPDFEENGIEETVLEALQQVSLSSWSSVVSLDVKVPS